MRVFKEFPETSVCPVCGTNDNKETVLIGIFGTEDEAAPVHLECIELTYIKSGFFVQQI